MCGSPNRGVTAETDITVDGAFVQLKEWFSSAQTAKLFIDRKKSAAECANQSTASVDDCFGGGLTSPEIMPYITTEFIIGLV